MDDRAGPFISGQISSSARKAGALVRINIEWKQHFIVNSILASKARYAYRGLLKVVFRNCPVVTH
jgi:hypothetical protein